VDMRSTRQVGWLVGDMSSHRSRVLSSSEAVTKRRRLNDSLIGELLMRRSNDGEARRCLVSSRHARRLGSKLRVVFVGSVSLGGLLVKSGFDDMSLLFSNRHASLQLLLHDRILRDKAGRKAGNANFLNSQAVSSSHGPC